MVFRTIYEIIMGVIGVIDLIAAIWVIYDVLVKNKRLSEGMKVLWIVYALFIIVVHAIPFGICAAIIYYLVGRNNQNDLFRKNRR